MIKLSELSQLFFENYIYSEGIINEFIYIISEAII